MVTRQSGSRAAGLCLVVLAAVATASCATPEDEQRAQLSCAGGVVAGAALGAVIGNQFGDGRGRSIMTAGGAAAGGAAGASAAC